MIAYIFQKYPENFAFEKIYDGDFRKNSKRLTGLDVHYFHIKFLTYIY